jgi:methionine-rich copper-binding protein CopC
VLPRGAKRRTATGNVGACDVLLRRSPVARHSAPSLSASVAIASNSSSIPLRVTGKTFSLSAGTHTIKVKVPRRARAGRYRVSLRVTAADGTRKSFAKRLHLRR